MTLQLSDLIQSVVIDARDKRHVFDDSHFYSKDNDLIISFKSEIYLDDVEFETVDGNSARAEARTSLVTIIRLRFSNFDLVSETYDFSLVHIHNEPWIYSMRQIGSDYVDLDNYDSMQRSIYEQLLSYYALSEDEIDGNIYPVFTSIYR